MAHSVKPLCLNVAGNGFKSRWRMTGLQEVLWSEAARTLLLFQMSDLPCAFVLNQKSIFVPFHLNFCSVLNFWTYMFILCTLCFCRFALPALRRPSCSSRARPRHCCLQLYWILFLLDSFFLGKWGSVATLWRENGKIMKIDTLVEMAINRDLTNFGVSKTNSIAPPPVQKFNIEVVITRKLLMVEKLNLVHLICLFMLITFNNLH